MSTIENIMTAVELLQTPGLGRCELVHGELIQMTPAGFEHGRIAAEIGGVLRDFVKARALGVVTGAETGFHIGHDPDTVRAPDAAFIRQERVPPTPVRGFFPAAPDLAVEIISPGDRAGEVLAKAKDWLGAGCGAVWVLDPETKTVTVYRGLDRIVVLDPDDTLTGDDVLPGFSLPVGEIFAG
ncbi:MAG: Uma2 family endonuclease [Planctomycetes bacterium]|nr:Uma2 family endonuclease [Planctomycetota bacterium]MCG2685059.1 Uma2 family endonuclease [Planctomycetales bacterium]